MSSRRERRERASAISAALTGITACNYGAHPFVRQELPERFAGMGGVGTHLHYCPECEASYFESDPCWCGGAS